MSCDDVSKNVKDKLSLLHSFAVSDCFKVVDRYFQIVNVNS